MFNPALYYLSSATDFLKSLWHFELTEVDGHPLTFSKVIGAVLLLFLGLWLSRRISGKLSKKVFGKLSLTLGALTILEHLTFYTLVFVFAATAFTLLHIPLHVFTFLGGALAIGVGFGSQNVMNNFISGLIILAEQPVRVGDIIEFNGMSGSVKRIGTRSTIVTTSDNFDVVIPNSALLQDKITNWTLSDKVLRRSVKVGIAYGTDPKRVEAALLQVISGFEAILREPKPEVLLTDFADSALQFELRFWVQIGSISEALRLESRIRQGILEAFEQSQIVIPFPQRQVHIKQAS